MEAVVMERFDAIIHLINLARASDAPQTLEALRALDVDFGEVEEVMGSEPFEDEEQPDRWRNLRPEWVQKEAARTGEVL